MDELKQYKIDVPPAALADVDEIVDYLNTLSAETAVKHLTQINDGINSLRTLPLRCPPAKNDEYAKKRMALSGSHLLPCLFHRRRRHR